MTQASNVIKEFIPLLFSKKKKKTRNEILDLKQFDFDLNYDLENVS